MNLYLEREMFSPGAPVMQLARGGRRRDEIKPRRRSGSYFITRCLQAMGEFYQLDYTLDRAEKQPTMSETWGWEIPNWLDATRTQIVTQFIVTDQARAHLRSLKSASFLDEIQIMENNFHLTTCRTIKQNMFELNAPKKVLLHSNKPPQLLRCQIW